MQKQKLTKKEKQNCFGWSKRAWFTPWNEFEKNLENWQGNTGLEIGAGAKASLAPLMLEYVEKVQCSVYDKSTLPAIKSNNKKFNNIEYTTEDILNLNGKWDIIIMKSVLGGIFRHDGYKSSGSIDEMQKLISKIKNENLNKNGWLITIDNGKSPLEPFMKNFGARKNGWRYLEHKDFPPADFYSNFGTFSTFSAATRLGFTGHILDNIFYNIDKIANNFHNSPAIHLHAWQNKNKA